MHDFLLPVDVRVHQVTADFAGVDYEIDWIKEGPHKVRSEQINDS